VRDTLTERQAEVLATWAQIGLNKLGQPTLRELADNLHLKSKSATLQVRPLVRKGYLEVIPHYPKNGRGAGLALSKKGWEALQQMQTIPSESDLFFRALRRNVLKEVKNRSKKSRDMLQRRN
jgi:DNA-binding MarR family transcriptional regulator